MGASGDKIIKIASFKNIVKNAFFLKKKELFNFIPDTSKVFSHFRLVQSADSRRIVGQSHQVEVEGTGDFYLNKMFGSFLNSYKI